jgi:hypothetical protein
MAVANLVGSSQRPRQLLVVIAQLADHLERKQPLPYCYPSAAGIDYAELAGRDRHYRGGQKAATIVVDLFDHFSPSDQIPFKAKLLL